MLPQDKSLRILHIINHSLPIYDGYTFRSHNIVQAQQKKGWHPLVLTSPKYEEYWKGAWQPIEVLDGICHYRTGPVSSHALPFATEIHLMQAVARRLREVIKLETPTLLHAHSPILNAIPALWVGCREGIPAVYEMRASWEDAGVDHGTYQHDSVCRRARQVAVLCEGLKKGLMQRGIPSDKLTVVPNGVNVDHMTRGDSESEFKQMWNLDGKKIVGFIGSFYRYEG